MSDNQGNNSSVKLLTSFVEGLGRERVRNGNGNGNKVPINDRRKGQQSPVQPRVVQLPSFGVSSSEADTLSELEFVKRMNKPVQVFQQQVPDVPDALLESITCTFGQVLDQRIARSAQTILHHHHHHHHHQASVTRRKKQLDALESDSEDNKRLSSTSLPLTTQNLAVLSQLSSLPPVSFASSKTSFRTLPGHVKDRKAGGKAIILPVVFRVVIDLEIKSVDLGKTTRKSNTTKCIPIQLNTPGTVVGSFSKEGILDWVVMQVDMDRLFRCMKVRSHQVIRTMLQDDSMEPLDFGQCCFQKSCFLESECNNEREPSTPQTSCTLQTDSLDDYRRKVIAIESATRRYKRERAIAKSMMLNENDSSGSPRPRKRSCHAAGQLQ